MLWLQQAYISRLSFLLNKLNKVGDTYNFRCPFCGDSKKTPLKTRGYLYVSEDGQSYNYRCHNCGASMSFYSFLNKMDVELCKEYVFESLRHNEKNVPMVKEKKKLFEINGLHELVRDNYHPKLSIPSIQSLPDDNECKKYVISRKIPKKHWNRLYYADDFSKFLVTIGTEDGKYPSDKRLIIPAYNENKKLIYVQGRSLDPTSKMRYFTYEVDKSRKKLYGLDRVKYNKMIYVFEGPIDSLFVDNSIATMDSNLCLNGDMIKDNTTLVFDNQPRNPSFLKCVKKAVDLGYRCCFFPSWVNGKDVNEMVTNGMTEAQVVDLIDKNSFSGIQAKMKFNTWRKI